MVDAGGEARRWDTLRQPKQRRRRRCGIVPKEWTSRDRQARRWDTHSGSIHHRITRCGEGQTRWSKSDRTARYLRCPTRRWDTHRYSRPTVRKDPRKDTLNGTRPIEQRAARSCRSHGIFALDFSAVDVDHRRFCSVNNSTRTQRRCGLTSECAQIIDELCTKWYKTQFRTPAHRDPFLSVHPSSTAHVPWTFIHLFVFLTGNRGPSATPVQGRSLAC